MLTNILAVYVNCNNRETVLSMKKSILFCFAVCLAAGINAQFSFTNSSSLLNGSYHSGGVVGVVDMDGDGLDDIIIFDYSQDLVIEYQTPSGTFTREDYGASSTLKQWGAAVGDIDGDGHKDVFSGGKYDGVHVVSISQLGVYTRDSLLNGNMFMQCANLADINNDGWLDAFGCHDDAESRIWLNDQSGNLNFSNVIDFTTIPASDMSGNYGSCWTDFDQDGDIDLYIAKCRSGVNDPTDPRRVNVLYVNDGSGNFSNEAPQRGIDLGDQSWSADFGDIDNDGDFDLVVTNHDNNIRLFENDGSGNFSEITTGSGIGITGFFLQSIFRDFDNDGYLDLLVSGGFGSSYLFKGNGDGTFSDESTAIQSSDELHSFGVGDLNHDGFLDYYASYGDVYVDPDPIHEDILWINDGNSNNWAAFNLEATVSNASAVGTITRIYGPWGVQVREVRAGESYGINNSFDAHFGLAAATMIDSVVFNWPSGIVDRYSNISAGSYFTAVEGQGLSIGLEESDPLDLVSVWPNPSNGIFNLTLNGTSGDVHVEVIDVSGKLVWTEARAQNNMSMDLSALNPGVFLLRIQLDEQIIIKRIVRH